MYQIVFNNKVGLLEITVQGFWTVDVVHAFHRDYLQVIERLGKTQPYFPTLSDSRQLAVLPKDAMEAFGRGAAEVAARHRGRVAVVFSSVISKLQAERMSLDRRRDGLERGLQRYFTDIEEARSWALERENIRAI